MHDAAGASRDPRWGQHKRDKKAEAILATLRLRCGQDLRRETWLDIGCGSGGIAATLATHVERMIGIDPESWERWSTFREEYPNLDLLTGSYPDLVDMLGQDSIDVVICNQVYEHVDNPIALLKAIHRVLRPGGLCYFAGPNLLWPVEPHVFWPFVHWLPRKFAQGLMRILGSRHAHELDAWSWPYWKLIRAFRSAGFLFSEAINQRVRVEAKISNSMLLKLAALLPQSIISALTPIMPSFIFILVKPVKYA